MRSVFGKEVGHNVCHINCGRVTAFAAEIGIINMKSMPNVTVLITEIADAVSI